MRGPEPGAVHGCLPPTAGTLHPRTRMLDAYRRVGSVLVRRWYEVHEHDRNLLPARGGCIVASNHVGFLDGPLLVTLCPRPVHALTKKEMFVGATGGVLRALGQIPLSRAEVDMRAVKTCVRVLRDGGVLGVYPEGSRGAGDFTRIHRGVAYLAMVTGAPVVPLVMLGTRVPGGGTGSVPRRGSRIDLVYGTSFTPGARPWPRCRREVDRVSDRVRAELLAHLDSTLLRTGRRLPGPLPERDHRVGEDRP